MALASTSPDLPASLNDLDTLYPLACMLVGPEAAPALLVGVYERGAETPPAERPETLDDWLPLLLREAAGEARTSDASADRDAIAASSDSLRREVAEHLLQKTVPVALATCSATERFFLSLNALGVAESISYTRLADAVEGSPPPDSATLLRHKLRGVLSPPEADLLESALSDEDLQDAVRDYLRDRFAPVPSSLRAHLRSTVKTASPPSSGDTSSPPASSVTADESSERLLDRLPSRPRPRTLLIVLVLGALVVAGGLGVSYMTGSPPTASSSAAPPSLVAFSAGQTGAVTTERPTSRRSVAEAHLDSTWDRQVRLPTIEGARLEGIGRLQATGNVEVPVAMYADTEDDTRIAAFLYNYALVDRLDGAATLGTRVRSALGQRNDLVSAEQSSPAGLLWRDRSTIFVVVAPGLSTDALRARVQP